MLITLIVVIVDNCGTLVDYSMHIARFDDCVGIYIFDVLILLRLGV